MYFETHNHPFLCQPICMSLDVPINLKPCVFIYIFLVLRIGVSSAITEFVACIVKGFIVFIVCAVYSINITLLCLLI